MRSRTVRIPFALERREPLRFVAPSLCACCGAPATSRFVHALHFVRKTHAVVVVQTRTWSMQVALPYCAACHAHVSELRSDKASAAIIAVLVVAALLLALAMAAGLEAVAFGLGPAIGVAAVLYLLLLPLLARRRLGATCTMNPVLKLRPSGLDVKVGSDRFFGAVMTANADAVEVVRR
jgi:hypothetical protein